MTAGRTEQRERRERRTAALALAAVLVGSVLGCGSESRTAEGDRGVDESDAPGTSSAASRPVPVWLDVDPAIGLPSSEVDDGLMMLQVFNSPELEVRGVSVVFGNTSLENGLPIARDIVARFGPGELTVAPGAASAEQLGAETEAVAAMARALEEAPMTLLAVGPVTNVGSLVQLHPELHDRIDRIVVVAGRRVGQSFRTGDPSNVPHRDFNFELDPAAMQAILDTEIRLELAPWEVSSHVWLRSADLAALAEFSEAGRWVADNTKTWVERWRANLGVDGFNPFDTLAAGMVSHPELIETLEVVVWIEEGEDDRDPTGVEMKPFLLVAPVLGEEPDRMRRTATYAYLPEPGFRDLLLERLAGRPE